MSEMDWETSGQQFAPHQSSGQTQCPYRPPTTTSGNFQFPGLQSQLVNPNLSFHPPHAPPQGFWDNIPQQNMLPHEGMSNRFIPMNAGSHPPGRASDISSFGYHMGLDGHSPPSGPTRPSRFDAGRPLPQRTRSYLAAHTAEETQGGLAGGSNQSSSAGAVDLTSNYNGGNARRNGSANAVSHENGPSNLPPSQSRHLPPPNSTHHGLFPPQNVPYPRQPRFSVDVNVPNSIQGSTSSLPPHPPSLSSWARAEPSSHNTAHRNWFHEAFISTPTADLDSDDDSIDTQEESFRRQGRPDPHTALQFWHEQMRLPGGSRRVNPFDTEGPEASLERARAARRAAAAAVKLVASPSALAALEPVDLNGLGADEKSCIICYNEFGVKNPDGFVECPVRLPKCKHIFGDRCLKQWLQDSDSCPYCRDKLPSEPKRTPSDDARRIIAQSRTFGIEPWVVGYAAGMQAESGTPTLAMEREQQYHQFIRHRLGREDSADEIVARRDDYDWGASFSQSSIGLPSRSIPDYDGRRRYRGRHSVSRMATQTAGRSNGFSSTRSARNVNLQPGPMRAPIHSSTPSFDENSTSQRRSVTPHPTITGTYTWSSPPQIQSAASGRPSSLPTERSPLGEAAEVPPNIPGSRTPSGGSTMSTPFTDHEWNDSHHTSNNALLGWRMPITDNGRPASASFINDISRSRLQQIHDDLGAHLRNNRPPLYMTASNEADLDPHTGSQNRR